MTKKELIRKIGGLKSQGYTTGEIAKILDITEAKVVKIISNV